MAHFYAGVPEDVASLSHRDAVERFVAGAPAPGEAIRDLTREQLLSFPIPGTWSIQQIVLHLMDTDLIAAYRMKRIIAEDQPALDVYDETRFADRLAYDRQDASLACEAFRLNRLMVGNLLGGLPEEAFSRVARHPERGEMPLGAFVRLYVHHLAHHLRFIEAKRRLVAG